MSDSNPTQSDPQKSESQPSAVEDMAASPSKLADPDKDTIVKKGSNEGIFSLIYTAVKKVALFGAIYLVGYMGWSVAWLIGPIVLAIFREQYYKSNARKRENAKACAMADEKDVIMAKIDELPAWVYFPDVERCEWVNKVVKQLWPNANYFARDLVKKSIEPNIAKALAKFKLSGFKFDRIILGTIPPRIGGVKIYDKNVARNEIIMDVDLFYTSDCDINFILGGMKGGIKDFQIHGMLRVVMKPLIRQMPLIGGLQIFFLNNPSVDFNLVGVIDLLDMPGLSDILKRVVVEQIGNIMVLPNKLPIKLNDSVSALELKMPEPEGVLRIHVIEAKDLMKKDVGMLGKGKSDPYAIVTVGSQEFRTQTIDNTVNPKWDYWCEVPIFFNDGQFVEVELHDSDDTSNDEKLGRASIEIGKAVKKGVLDSWIVLENARHGMLHIRLTWLTLSPNYDDLKLAFAEMEMLGVTTLSTSILSVFIDSAKNLPQARMQSQPDPYAILTMGKKTEQTGVQMRTHSPVWEQGFSFLVSNPDNTNLQLKVVDQKTGNDLGHYTFVLNTLLTSKGLAIESQPFQLQKSGPESKIIITLALRILKRIEPEESDDEDNNLQSDGGLSRTDSLSSNFTSPLKSQESTSGLLKQLKDDTDSIIEDIQSKTTVSSMMSAPSRSPTLSERSGLTHRVPDITQSPGESGLGRILLTIRYSLQRQRLTITVHKIMNIPLKDPAHIPDPYVKLYLLPTRAKESKRKTVVVKDNCNPVYDASFEYIISSAELSTTELEVTVCSQKGFLYGGSPIIGMAIIPMRDPEIATQGFSSWYDLQPEIKHE